MELFKTESANIRGNEVAMSNGEVYDALLLMRDHKIALGEHENILFAEYKKDDVISMVTIDTKKKLAKGFRMNAVTRYSAGDFLDDNLADRTVAVALLLNILSKQDEASALSMAEFYNLHVQNPTSFNAKDEYIVLLAVNSLTSTLIANYANEESAISAFAPNKKIGAINVAQIEAGNLAPSKVISGNFVGFKNDKVGAKRVQVKMEDINQKFLINPSREFTTEEQNLMYKIPDWYSPSSNVISIAEKIKKSWDGPINLRKVNVLMEGPAGTGKTTDAKVLSALLGIPYTKITCFSDMDSSDVTGSILPVAEEEKKFDIEIPSDDEIFLDPAGCYEQLKGERLSEYEKEQISDQDVRDLISEIYEDFYNSDEGQSDPRYIYYASEIVKAFENGWLIEIQERATRLAVKSCYTIESI